MAHLEISPRRPANERVKVLGISEIDQTQDGQEKSSSDLLSPLGEICNRLRAIRSASTEERSRIEQEIREIHLPKLQSAVSFWAGDGKAGAAISEEKIIAAMEHVEGGGMATRDFARQIVTNATTIAERDPKDGHVVNIEKTEAAIHSLVQDPAFQKTISYMAHLEHNMDEAVALELLRTRVKDVVEDVFPQAAQDEGGRSLWLDGSLSTEKVRRMRTRAFYPGTGLDTTANRLLDISTIDDGDERIRVRDMIQDHIGRFRLPTSALQDPVSSARGVFLRRKPPIDALIIDRPFGIDIDGEKRVVSVDNAMSKITYALQTEGRRGDAAEEVERFPLAKGISELKTVMRAKLVNVAALGKKEVLGKDTTALDEILAKIDEKFLREELREAKRRVKKPNDPSLDAKMLLAQRDPFVQLDRELAARVLSLTAADGRSLLQVFVDGSHGKYTQALFAGVWHDRAIDATLQAENVEQNPGTKMLRSLEFIYSLPELVEKALATRTDIDSQEKDEIRLVTQAFHNIVTRIELRRRMDEATESGAGERKGRAEQSAGIQKSYAQAYGVLFNRNLVPPPPPRPEYPEKEEGQSDEEYNALLRELITKNAVAQENEKRDFEKDRHTAIMRESRQFLERLHNDQDLRGVFFGTLRFASGLSNAEVLKKAVRDEMDILRASKDVKIFEDTRSESQIASGVVFHPELGLRQPNEALRNFLNEFASRYEKAKIQLDEFFTKADTLYGNILTTDDPGSQIGELQNLRDEMDGKLLDEITWMRESIHPFLPEERAKRSSDEVYMSLWRQAATPHLERFVRLVHERNNVHDTALVALAVGYLREGTMGAQKDLEGDITIPQNERSALERQIQLATLLTTQYAHPHMLRATGKHTFPDGTTTEVPSFEQILPIFWGTGIQREFTLEKISYYGP